MVRAVAGEGTVSAARAAGNELEAAIGNGVRYRAAVEVDEAALLSDSVSIVAGAARGLCVHDVKPVSPLLPERVHRAEALVGEDAGTVMAFVAKRIIQEAFIAAVL